MILASMLLHLMLQISPNAFQCYIQVTVKYHNLSKGLAIGFLYPDVFLFKIDRMLPGNDASHRL